MNQGAHIYKKQFDPFFLIYKTISDIKNNKQEILSFITARMCREPDWASRAPGAGSAGREPQCLHLPLGFPSPLPSSRCLLRTPPSWTRPYFTVASLSRPEGSGKGETTNHPPLETPLSLTLCPTGITPRQSLVEPPGQGRNRGCLGRFLDSVGSERLPGPDLETIV